MELRGHRCICSTLYALIALRGAARLSRLHGSVLPGDPVPPLGAGAQRVVSRPLHDRYMVVKWPLHGRYVAVT